MTDRKGYTVILTGGLGIGTEIEAPVLVSKQGFGVRYDLDQVSGIISNPDHDLYGKAVMGKILVFTKPKGGVAASWSLAGLLERGIAPAGIIFQHASPIFVQGAIFAGIPLMSGFSEDPCVVLRSGNKILLEPSEGYAWIRQ